MSTQSLFQSLKAQTLAQSTDNPQSIRSQNADLSRWALFQSIEAAGWDPTAPLSIEEKLKRQTTVPCPVDSLESAPHLYIQQESDRLTLGLRDIKRRAQTQAAIQQRTFPTSESLATKTPDAFALVPGPIAATRHTSVYTPRAFNQAAQSLEHDSQNVFRFRLSKLFVRSDDAQLSAFDSFATNGGKTSKDSKQLLGIFDRIQGRKIISFENAKANPKANPNAIAKFDARANQSLRNTFGRLARSHPSNQ